MVPLKKENSVPGVPTISRDERRQERGPRSDFLVSNLSSTVVKLFSYDPYRSYPLISETVPPVHTGLCNQTSSGYWWRCRGWSPSPSIQKEKKKKTMGLTLLLTDIDSCWRPKVSLTFQFCYKLKVYGRIPTKLSTHLFFSTSNILLCSVFPEGEVSMWLLNEFEIGAFTLKKRFQIL